MRILIVEDEPMIARRIERMSRELLGERASYFKTLHHLPEATAFLFETPIDLLFLDLNLNGRDGFDLLKTSVSGAFHTIIISAHANQALRAFDYGVLDFIGKPFNKERLEKAFRRLQHAEGRAAYGAKYLAIRTAGRLDLVDLNEVWYIKGAGPYSEVILADGATALHDKSLDRLLAILPPSFERIHKSYIVKMDVVARLRTYEGSRYQAELRDGSTLPVGRTRYKAIKKKLGF